MAKLIKTDGTVQEVYPSDKENGFSLEELYKLIGCDTVELIRLCQGLYMIVDEEATLKTEQVVNVKASSFFVATTIIGNVVICNDKEFQ